MNIPWRDLARKLARFLDRVAKEEAVKEIERRAHPSDPPLALTFSQDSEHA